MLAEEMDVVSSEKCRQRIAIKIGSRTGANSPLKSSRGQKLRRRTIRGNNKGNYALPARWPATIFPEYYQKKLHQLHESHIRGFRGLISSC